VDELLSSVGPHEALKQRPAVHQKCVTKGFDYLQPVICDVAEMAAPKIQFNGVWRLRTYLSVEA
jgi:hypothetical protein